MTKEKIIIRNAHCKFFEGQTGLCKAKEFTKCNPVNCKSYTIDELSTILELQEKLQTKEQECEELRGRLNIICFDPRANNNHCISYNRMAEDYEKDKKKINKYKQALVEIEKQVKAMNNECFYDDFCECNNCDMKNGCSYYRKFNILDIINKVQGK